MFNGFKKLAAVAAVATAATLGSARTASAGIAPTTLTLDSLLEGGKNEGGITLGDKLYDNFNFSSSGQTVLSAEDVEVVIAMEGNNHYIAFLFDLTSTGTARSDVVIGYDLRVTDPDRHIESVGLLFDGTPFDLQVPAAAGAPAPSRAAATVIETVTMVDGDDLVPGGETQATELFSVFNDGEGGLEDNFENTLAINPSRHLRFTKDILVSSRGDLGAGITTVENSVTQNGTATVIPLPAAFSAAIPVLGGLVAGKKVRRLLKRN